MGFTANNFLKRVIEVQNIVLHERELHGTSQKRVYEEKIKEQYHISYSTFTKWMCRNAKLELSKLEKDANNTIKTNC
jgi:hypothetical protein